MLQLRYRTLEPINKTGAIFSRNRKKRYQLWRIWNDQLSKVLFIGLNPSNANENENDPTLRRMIAFAQNWGYGGIYVVNVNPQIAVKPSELNDRFNKDSINEDYLRKSARKCAKVIMAWGNSSPFSKATQRIIRQFPKAEVLGVNLDGSPKHPLYLRKDIVSLPYKKIKHPNPKISII